MYILYNINLSPFRQEQGHEESLTRHLSSIGKNSCISESEKYDFNGISENASGIMSETATSEKINKRDKCRKK